MTLLNWNDRVVRLLEEIRNNGTPQGSAEGLNLRVLDVNVSNANPVPVSDGGGALTVDGTINVGNFPTTQQVGGTINVGNFPTTQQIIGQVAVVNLPTTQMVSGLVSISNQPLTTYLTFEDFGMTAGGVVKVGTGAIFSICAHNLSTSTTRYFQLHNKAAAPTTGDVPELFFPVCSCNSWVLDNTFFGALGRFFSDGIAWGWSNTPKSFSAVQSPSEHATFINYL